MPTKEGTFLVAEAGPESALLRDVSDGQVHTLSENPGVEPDEVVEATLTAEPPMEVTWRADVESVREVDLVEADLEPTVHAREAAAEQADGDLTTIERAGEGEVHVLTVGPDAVEDAVADVLDDRATIERAAQLGAVRVEVRTGETFLSVRYLPD